MTALTVEALHAGYGPEEVLRGVDLSLGAGTTGVVLGPSGSGKSTLLAAIAGFLPARSGRVMIDGTVVSSPSGLVPPERRSVGVVFQDHALWPHLTVLENVAYPLRRARQQQPEREAREILSALDVDDLATRGIDSLSGGQQQRVSIARALARRPGLFLFDEPTSALDGALRDTVRDRVEEQRRATGASALYATHDAAEALAVADTIILLRGGRVVQHGDPATVYTQPADEWAALLTGPATTIDAAVDARRWVVAGIDSGVAAPDSDEGRIMFRPEWASPFGPIPGTVASTAYRGAFTDYRLDTPAGQIVARAPGPPDAARGDAIGWTLHRCWPIR
jgi:ABC-type Fe3+/spermidine/putrescine transport system ATPase subunit